jgi:putative ABC transport system permease protein
VKLPSLVWRNLRRRPLATALTTISVALGVGLFSAVGSLRDASETAFVRSAGICNFVVGAKGSPLELTLNALYHMGTSAGNVPYSLYREVRETTGVLWSVPMVVGDSYQGFRIVGVTDDFFTQLEIPDLGKPQLAAGSAFQFSAQDLDDFHKQVEQRAADPAGPIDLAEIASLKGWFVAVIGSQVAKQSDLALGAHFMPAHDVMTAGAGEHHQEAETEVVGVLQETGTPLDRAIFIPTAAFYAVQGHQATSETTLGGTRDPSGLSSILVRTKPGYYQLQVFRKFNDRLDAQAAQPSLEIRKLFQVVGSVDAALRLIALMVVVVAMVGVLVAIYNTMGARRKEFAVLRALGARRRTILGLVMAESALISLLGGILGMLVAGVGVALASEKVRSLTGVGISPLPTWQDLQFLLAIAVVGALAGLVPAARAYRTEAARYLSASL